MKVTVEVRKLDAGRWMAQAEWNDTLIFGYGTQPRLAEMDLIDNIQRQKRLDESTYTKEIDV